MREYPDPEPAACSCSAESPRETETERELAAYKGTMVHFLCDCFSKLRSINIHVRSNAHYAAIPHDLFAIFPDISRSLSSDSASKLNVLGHNRDTLGMDSTQVGVLEQTNQV